MQPSKIRRGVIASIAATTLLAPAAAQAHRFSQRQLKSLVSHSVTGRPVVFAPQLPPAPSLSGLGIHVGTPRLPAAPSPQGAANDLIYHGGAILQRPKAYLIFYGSQWKDNSKRINIGGQSYTPASAIRYLTQFFSGIGGSRWMGVTKQYCDNVPIGTTDCSGIPGAEFVTNPRNQLGGVWIDASAPAPSTIVTSGLAENQVAQDPIASEAEKATLHFGYDPQAVYMVFTPPGTQATLYNVPTGYYCAYHNQASTITRARTVQYAFMPYVPEQGAGCRDNTVFKHNDAYGHGYYDSYSITAGHEYLEAVTDPGNYFSVQDGWNDASTSENGDKCVSLGIDTPATPAWPLKAITLRLPNGTTQRFAVQPTWSNADFDSGNKDGGCSFG
jgi:hypothetical protein